MVVKSPFYSLGPWSEFVSSLGWDIDRNSLCLRPNCQINIDHSLWLERRFLFPVFIFHSCTETTCKLSLPLTSLFLLGKANYTFTWGRNGRLCLKQEELCAWAKYTSLILPPHCVHSSCPSPPTSIAWEVCVKGVPTDTNESDRIGSLLWYNQIGPRLERWTEGIKMVRPMSWGCEGLVLFLMRLFCQAWRFVGYSKRSGLQPTSSIPCAYIQKHLIF